MFFINDLSVIRVYFYRNKQCGVLKINSILLSNQQDETSLPSLDCYISLTVFFLLSCFRYSDDVEPQKMLCLGKRNPKSNGFCAVVKDGWPRLLMDVLTFFQCFSVAFVIFKKKKNILQVLQYRRKWIFFYSFYSFILFYILFLNDAKTTKLWSLFFPQRVLSCFFFCFFFLLLHCDTCQ